MVGRHRPCKTCSHEGAGTRAGKRPLHDCWKTAYPGARSSGHTACWQRATVAVRSTSTQRHRNVPAAAAEHVLAPVRQRCSLPMHCRPDTPVRDRPVRLLPRVPRKPSVRLLHPHRVTSTVPPEDQQHAAGAWAVRLGKGARLPLTAATTDTTTDATVTTDTAAATTTPKPTLSITAPSAVPTSVAPSASSAVVSVQEHVAAVVSTCG